MKTLEQYLRDEYADGKIDFWFRVHTFNGGPVEIYIHPMNEHGETTPVLIVDGNTVRPKVWPSTGETT
jgi:hypothetical protein